MTQLLIAIEDFQLTRLLQSTIAKKYEIKSRAFPDSEQLLLKLETYPSTKLLICSEKFNQSICDYLTNHHEKFDHIVKVLVLGETKSSYAHVSSLELDVTVSEVVHEAGFLLGLEQRHYDEPPPIPGVIAVESIKAEVIEEEVVEEKFVEEKIVKLEIVKEEIVKAAVKEEVKEEVKTEEKIIQKKVIEEIVKEVIKEEIAVEEEDNHEKTTVFKMPDLGLVAAPKVELESIPEDDSVAIVEYVSVSMKYFIHLPKVKINFDVYSRIKKDDEFVYHIKIASGSEISKVEVDRLSARGGKDLYIIKSEFARANEFLNTYFLSRFKSPSISIIDRMLLNSESYEILLEVFQDSSFTKYSIEIIKELIKSIDVLFNSSSAIEGFFVSLKQKELSYGYYHSYLTGLLIFKMIDKFSWKKDQSKNKIIYLALFHDLALHNNRLIEAHHHMARDFNKLSEAEKQILNTHADTSASILEKIVKAPKVLTLLIREHHGLRHGIGFTDALSLGINPLSMACIVTEDFVTSYLKLWQSSDKDKVHEFIKTYPEEIFKELSVKYDKLTYADVVEELKNLIKGLQ